MATVNSALKKKLILLSEKYETKDFLNADPSQFLYYYKNPRDIELCAFISALLSFGNRKQFIPKIEFLMQQADLANGIYFWLKDSQFEKIFSPTNNKKFYRFYSYKDMYYLFSKLRDILYVEQTLGIFLSNKYIEKVNQVEFSKNANFSKTDNFSEAKKINIIDIISENFSECKIVPSTKSSAKKRLCMFARWMVRDNSPVDIGLWTWFSKSNLIIPLDVHVIKEAIKLNLLEPKSNATRKTAEQLTKIAKEIFYDDPCKLDFALFGLGVDK